MSVGGLFLKLAAIVPVPFLLAGSLGGGPWAFVALFYLTIFTFLADESLFAVADLAEHRLQLDRALSAFVPVTLALSHLVLLPAVVAALALGAQSPGEKLVLFLAHAVFFGMISTANAHELIHRTNMLHRTLGKWVFISVLFGHHTSAHLAVHHPNVATADDPNSAPLNKGFYRFFLEAWRGSFEKGLAVERARLARKGLGVFSPYNPYVIYVAGALVFLLAALAIAGPVGVLYYGMLAGFAQAQLLLSDYVQHYGLVRARLPGGRYERVTVRHSWNAPHAFSSALMLNAPRHSDHHAHPTVHYPALRNRISQGAPTLPRSLPAMSCLALVPPLWKKVMNPLVEEQIRPQNGPERMQPDVKQGLPA